MRRQPRSRTKLPAPSIDTWSRSPLERHLRDPARSLAGPLTTPPTLHHAMNG
jgi:hypothetical protein